MSGWSASAGKAPRGAEFAPAELGSALATLATGARMLLADALDLRHRLPRLWARTEAGEVKPWIARRAAQASHHYPLALVLQVDAVIARYDRPRVGPAGWRG